MSSDKKVQNLPKVEETENEESFTADRGHRIRYVYDVCGMHKEPEWVTAAGNTVNSWRSESTHLQQQ